jgi:hypothetical protein
VETAIISAFVKHTGADPGVVGPEAYTTLGALFKKKEHKITCVSEYQFRERKEIFKNFKFKNAPNIRKSRKKSTMFY